MSDENLQKELFEYEPQKKSFSRLTNILPKADFDGRISFTFTLEKIVFIVIGIIMSFVIFYALGFENGKTHAMSGGADTANSVKNAVAETSKSAKEATSPILRNRMNDVSAKNILNTAPIASDVKATAQVKQITQTKKKIESPLNDANKFTIIVGTYSKLVSAQTASSILTKYGFNSTITYLKPYYRVCTGSYADKTSAEAENDLLKIRSVFKDAMFKLK